MNVIHKTGSTIHSLLHCRQRWIEPRPQVACTENFLKFGRVVFEICAQTDRHIDRHQDRNTSHLFSLCFSTSIWEPIYVSARY